jgi:hypothetical protein
LISILQGWFYSLSSDFLFLNAQNIKTIWPNLTVTVYTFDFVNPLKLWYFVIGFFIIKPLVLSMEEDSEGIHNVNYYSKYDNKVLHARQSPPTLYVYHREGYGYDDNLKWTKFMIDRSPLVTDCPFHLECSSSTNVENFKNRAWVVFPTNSLIKPQELKKTRVRVKREVVAGLTAFNNLKDDHPNKMLVGLVTIGRNGVRDISRKDPGISKEMLELFGQLKVKDKKK